MIGYSIFGIISDLEKLFVLLIVKNRDLSLCHHPAYPITPYFALHNSELFVRSHVSRAVTLNKKVDLSRLEQRLLTVKVENVDLSRLERRHVQ